MTQPPPAVTQVLSTQDVNDPEEVIRCATVQNGDINQLVFTSPRRTFEVANLGANPVYVAVKDESFLGVDPTTLPSSGLIKIPAVASGIISSAKIVYGARSVNLWLNSSGGTSSVQVRAGN